MSEPSSRPLACLDANIFRAVLIPEATRASIAPSLAIHAVVRKRISLRIVRTPQLADLKTLRPSQYR
jgi:hypothetical protein